MSIKVLHKQVKFLKRKCQLANKPAGIMYIVFYVRFTYL